MYAVFLSSEMKKWFRDPMMKFMLFYPVVFGLLGRYLLPYIAESSNFRIEFYSDIILVILALFTPQIFGALIAFSILDDRDDEILTSIRLTPLSIHQFLSFRLVLVWILSFGACIFVMWFSNIGGLKISSIINISLLAALIAPIVGLVINALSNNKIEGFAVMKGAGFILLIFPVISLFFIDIKELLFAVAPGYWPAKMISSLIRGEGVLLLTYQQYFWIGLAYTLLLNVVVYRFFLQRSREGK